MGEARVGALQARVRCLSAGPLGLWFLRETLGLEGAPARALLNEAQGSASLDIVLSAPWTASLRTLALHRLGIDQIDPGLIERVFASPAGQAIEHLDLRSLWLRGLAVERARTLAAKHGVRLSV